MALPNLNRGAYARLTSKSLRIELLLLGITLALLALPFTAPKWVAAPLLLCVLPGLACARWLGLSPTWKDARSWAVILVGGLAFSPLVVFTAAQLLPFSTARAAAAIAIVTFLALVTAPRPREVPPRLAFSKRAVALIAVTVLLLVVALAPVRNEYRSSILPAFGAFLTTDWYKHYGVTWEIEASGLPPKDLLYLEEPPFTHVYHLFFHLDAALLDLFADRAPGIGSSLVAVAAAACAGLLLSLYVLARTLWRNETAAVGSLLYASLLGGLDIVPNLANIIPRIPEGVNPFFHLETWGGCQSLVDTFFSIYIWVPQHAMALAIALLAWTVYLDAGGRWRSAIVCALLLVSAFGHSSYVPMGVVGGIGAYVLISALGAVRRRAVAAELSRALPWLVAALIALAAVVPLAVYELAGLLSRSAGSAEAPLSIWVRAAAIKPASRDLLHAMLFQWLFPGGAEIAQALDLPVLYLFEIGATLLAAFVGIAVWRDKLRERGWQIGALVAVASLLLTTFVKANIGCNDFGMRGVMPFQSVVALWAGGGWWVLLDRRNDLPPPTGTRDGAPEQARHPAVTQVSANALLALVGALAVVAAYQLPWQYRYVVAQPEGVPAGATGFYDAESADGLRWRWTRERALLPFDGVASNTPYRLVLNGSAGPRPAQAPPADVTIWANGQRLGQFTATAERQSVAFEVPPSLIAASTRLTVEMRVAAYRPSDFGQGDARRLGLILDDVSLSPLSPLGWLTLPPLDTVMAAFALSFFVLELTRRRLWFVVVVAAIGAALATVRPWTVPLLPYTSLVAGVVWCGARVVPPLADWVASWASSGKKHPALLLLAPFVCAGVGMTLWQVLTYDVSKLLPAQDWRTAVFDSHSLIVDRAFQFVRAQTPVDTVFQIDPGRENYAGWVSVAAERPHYFSSDMVFVYQVNEAEREARKQTVQQAFASQSASQACERFHRLGIQLVLIEPALYPWAANLSQEGECFRVLYTDEMWSVAAVLPR